MTCSRAKSSLALVAYSADPVAVKAHVVAAGWFQDKLGAGLAQGTQVTEARAELMFGAVKVLVRRSTSSTATS